MPDSSNKELSPADAHALADLIAAEQPEALDVARSEITA